MNSTAYVLVDRRDPTGEVLDVLAVDRLLRPPPRRELPTTNGWNPSLDRLVDWMAAQGEGNRNAALFWATCRAIEDGATDGDLDGWPPPPPRPGPWRRSNWLPASSSPQLLWPRTA